MKKVFNVYCDPGHAWLKVSFSDLRAVGMHPGQFSGYSYLSDDAIFLEEDCDLPAFAKAYVAVTGHAPTFREHVSRSRASRIRGYDRNTRTV